MPIMVLVYTLLCSGNLFEIASVRRHFEFRTENGTMYIFLKEGRGCQRFTRMGDTGMFKSLASGLTSSEINKLIENSTMMDTFCHYANTLRSNSVKIRATDPGNFENVYDNLYNLTLLELKKEIGDDENLLKCKT